MHRWAKSTGSQNISGPPPTMQVSRAQDILQPPPLTRCPVRRDRWNQTWRTPTAAASRTTSSEVSGCVPTTIPSTGPPIAMRLGYALTPSSSVAWGLTEKTSCPALCSFRNTGLAADAPVRETPATAIRREERNSAISEGSAPIGRVYGCRLVRSGWYKLPATVEASLFAAPSRGFSVRCVPGVGRTGREFRSDTA
jgi:hypothetical protein